MNSYHGWLWTPLVKHWGVPPQKTSVPGLRSTTLSHARKLCQTSGTSSQVSLQVSIADDAKPDDLTPEEISLPVKTLGLGTGILPGDVVQLQEEVGKVLGCLLATRSSLNAHKRKWVLDFQWPSARMSQKPLRPLKRPRLSVPKALGKLRVTE